MKIPFSPPPPWHGRLRRLGLGARRALDDAEDIGFLHDEPILTVDDDVGTGPFAEEHAIADFHIERLDLSSLIARARTDGQNLALDGLFLRRVRDDDASGSYFLGLDPLHQKAVVQWSKSPHASYPLLAVAGMVPAL